MKKSLLSLAVLLAIALPAVAETITFNGGNFNASLNGDGNYLFGENSWQKGTTYSEMNLNINSTGASLFNTSTYGNLREDLFNERTGTNLEIFASLSDFSFKNGVVTANVFGFEFGSVNGLFIEQDFNGKFSQQFSLGAGYGCCGSTSYNPTVGWTRLTGVPRGAAGSTVPEPGSMTLMGTGVLSLVGLMRRKLKLS
jgi:PEP-CTERM motif